MEVEYSNPVALWINDYETIPKPSNVGVKKFMGSIRLQLMITKEVVFKLGIAQESRPLSADEFQLYKELNGHYLGLASLQHDSSSKAVFVLFCQWRCEHQILPLKSLPP